MKKRPPHLYFPFRSQVPFFVLKPFKYLFGSFNYPFWIHHPKIHPDTKFYVFVISIFEIIRKIEKCCVYHSELVFFQMLYLYQIGIKS